MYAYFMFQSISRRWNLFQYCNLYEYEKEEFMSMTLLIGQLPVINIYWAPAMYWALIMELSRVISLILEVNIIIAILKVKKLEFREIKWFVQDDTLNENGKQHLSILSSNTSLSIFCVSFLEYWFSSKWIREWTVGFFWLIMSYLWVRDLHLWLLKTNWPG